MTDISDTESVSKLQQVLSPLLKETWQTSWQLIRITIPVTIIIKICEELGLIILIFFLYNCLYVVF